MLALLTRRENPTMTDDASTARPHPHHALPACLPRGMGIPLRLAEDPFAMPPWMPRLGRARDSWTSEDPDLRAAVLGLAAYCVTLAVLGVVAGSLILG